MGNPRHGGYDTVLLGLRGGGGFGAGVPLLDAVENEGSGLFLVEKRAQKLYPLRAVEQPGVLRRAERNGLFIGVGPGGDNAVHHGPHGLPQQGGVLEVHEVGAGAAAVQQALPAGRGGVGGDVVDAVVAAQQLQEGDGDGLGGGDGDERHLE